MRAKLLAAIKREYPKLMDKVVNITITRLSHGTWAGEYYAALHKADYMQNKYIRFKDVDDFKRQCAAREENLNKVVIAEG